MNWVLQIDDFRHAYLFKEILAKEEGFEPEQVVLNFVSHFWGPLRIVRSWVLPTSRSCVTKPF